METSKILGVTAIIMLTITLIFILLVVWNEKNVVRYELAHNEYIIFKANGWTNKTFEEWYIAALKERKYTFERDFEKFREALRE